MGHGRVGVAGVVGGNDPPQALVGDSRANGLAGRAATLPAGKSRRVQDSMSATGVSAVLWADRHLATALLKSSGTLPTPLRNQQCYPAHAQPAGAGMSSLMK